MDSYKANIINSVALISIGVWSYLEVLSLTALIHVVFGFILLLCSKGVKNKSTNARFVNTVGFRFKASNSAN